MHFTMTGILLSNIWVWSGASALFVQPYSAPVIWRAAPTLQPMPIRHQALHGVISSPPHLLSVMGDLSVCSHGFLVQVTAG